MDFVRSEVGTNEPLPVENFFPLFLAGLLYVHSKPPKKCSIGRGLFVSNLLLIKIHTLANSKWDKIYYLLEHSTMSTSWTTSHLTASHILSTSTTHIWHASMLVSTTSFGLIFMLFAKSFFLGILRRILELKEDNSLLWEKVEKNTTFENLGLKGREFETFLRSLHITTHSRWGQFWKLYTYFLNMLLGGLENMPIDKVDTYIK